MGVIMSNSHFQTTMTRGAQGHKVIKQVGLVLKFMKTSAMNVMDVKGASARTSLNTTIATNLVTFKHLLTYSLPVASMCQFFATTPMGTVLADHVLSSTFRRAILAPVLSMRQKSVELTTTVIANKRNLGHATGIGTFGRTMNNGWCFLVKSFSAVVAVDIGLLCLFMRLMTFTRTKNMLRVLARARGLPPELFATMTTSQGDGFTKGVNGALSRAMVDISLIRFELFSALEARLEHS